MSQIKPKLANLSPDGTLLYLRENPPEDKDSETYSDSDPGKLLGLAVTASSVPSWVSSEFDIAFEEHNNPSMPEADMNLYAHDWFERITYVPLESPDALAKLPVKDVVDQIVSMHAAFNHPLSTGCSLVSPRVKISEIPVKDGKITPFPTTDLSKDPAYYALVSKHDPNDLTIATEITVAPLSSREAFVKSKIHQRQLSNSQFLRVPVLVNSDLAKRRAAAVKAIQDSNQTP